MFEKRNFRSKFYIDSLGLDLTIKKYKVILKILFIR